MARQFGFGVGNTNGTRSFAGKAAADVTVEAVQAGGWLPIKYLDRDGKAYDSLEEIERQVVAAAKKAEPKRAPVKTIKKAFARLEQNAEPLRQDVERIRRALRTQQAALEQFQAAMEYARVQRQYDDDAVVLLLAS